MERVRVSIFVLWLAIAKSLFCHRSLSPSLKNSHRTHSLTFISLCRCAVAQFVCARVCFDFSTSIFNCCLPWFSHIFTRSHTATNWIMWLKNTTAKEIICNVFGAVICQTSRTDLWTSMKSLDARQYACYSERQRDWSLQCARASTCSYVNWIRARSIRTPNQSKCHEN